jgi:prolipoprotein diacylglyceryltransferase
MPDAYTTCWVAGILVGSVAANIAVRRRNALGPITFASGVLAVAGFLVGAKLQARIEQHVPPGALLSLPPAGWLQPPFRLPLGLLLGGTVALAWCRVWRAPWREAGDALALGALVMVAVGRFGCLLNGCCLGRVCGAWAAPLGVRFGPGTEAYAAQLQDGLIAFGAPRSLPAHPLPLYFALGALAILAVCLAALRRGAAPGRVLVTAAGLGSLGKLLLEPLRAWPRPPGLMVGVPLGVACAALAVVAVAAVRAALDTRRAGGPPAWPSYSAADRRGVR